MILRTDGGFGTDDNLEWALRQGYQLCAKGFSGKRAGMVGRRVIDWITLEPDYRWAALSPLQLSFCQPTRTIAVRWQRDGKLRHALYVVTDLLTPISQVCQQYGMRGAAEVEIRNDKQGLLLTHRRKRAWYAQYMLVLLNDLAHNLITSFRSLALSDTPLAEFGPYRIIQEVFNIPGKAVLKEGQLIELQLLETHPHAKVMAHALSRFWKICC